MCVCVYVCMGVGGVCVCVYGCWRCVCVHMYMCVWVLVMCVYVIALSTEKKLKEIEQNHCISLRWKPSNREYQEMEQALLGKKKNSCCLLTSFFRRIRKLQQAMESTDRAIKASHVKEVSTSSDSESDIDSDIDEQ